MSNTSTPISAWRLGASEAFGIPAAVLSAGFIGYGAQSADAGYSLWLTTLSTVIIWALPGQLVLHEMWGVGAAWFAILLAVGLTAVRFLPMAMTLMPVIRDERHAPWKLYVAAQFVSMTSWAVCMRRCDDLPREDRLAYLIAFSVTCWSASLLTGAIGYYAGGLLPAMVRLGLVFLTPIYFLCMLAGDARTRLARISLLCGAVSGPLLHRVDAQWGLLLAGLLAGTAGYLLQRAIGARRA
ncbi:MAG TPA: AzlC family ABC transporter permease [Burkholderiales bacterium]|nr:AzlC family ABC transporter permease [Burkholderiales bacterium]